MAEAISVVVNARWMPLSKDRVVVVDPSKGKYPSLKVTGGAGVAVAWLLLLLSIWVVVSLVVNAVAVAG